MNISQRNAGALVTSLVALASPLHAVPVAGVLQRPALVASQASHRVMLGLARAGTRIVAVGERGLALWSDDNGGQWQQAQVPVSVTLTAVAFVGASKGWAIGHAGTVLHTGDGGRSWRVQLDGVKVSQLLLQTASDPSAEAIAQQFAADGPDKPFLDIQFKNERSGIIVGAYGLILRTDDGGASWQPLMTRIANPKGLHIYAARWVGDTIYLAGEQGLLLRSDDGGATFVHLDSHYRGSFFTMAVLPSGALLVGGLKGNVFQSQDRGQTFQRCEGYPPVSVSAALVLDDGRVVLSNQAGQLFISDNNGCRVSLLQQAQAGAPLSALLKGGDGKLLGAGLRGISQLSVKLPMVSTGVNK
ncbi:MAG: YCF48-related protein [Pseudomonadota bacterium]